MIAFVDGTCKVYCIVLIAMDTEDLLGRLDLPMKFISCLRSECRENHRCDDLKVNHNRPFLPIGLPPPFWMRRPYVHQPGTRQRQSIFSSCARLMRYSITGPPFSIPLVEIITQGSPAMTFSAVPGSPPAGNTRQGTGSYLAEDQVPEFSIEILRICGMDGVASRIIHQDRSSLSGSCQDASLLKRKHYFLRTTDRECGDDHFTVAGEHGIDGFVELCFCIRAAG